MEIVFHDAENQGYCSGGTRSSDQKKAVMDGVRTCKREGNTYKEEDVVVVAEPQPPHRVTSSSTSKASHLKHR